MATFQQEVQAEASKLLGTTEQWVYGGRNYLYFKNGVLTTIQN